MGFLPSADKNFKVYGLLLKSVWIPTKTILVFGRKYLTSGVHLSAAVRNESGSITENATTHASVIEFVLNFLRSQISELKPKSKTYCSSSISIMNLEVLVQIS